MWIMVLSDVIEQDVEESNHYEFEVKLTSKSRVSHGWSVPQGTHFPTLRLRINAGREARIAIHLASILSFSGDRYDEAFRRFRIQLCRH